MSSCMQDTFIYINCADKYVWMRVSSKSEGGLGWSEGQVGVYDVSGC